MLSNLLVFVIQFDFVGFNANFSQNFFSKKLFRNLNTRLNNRKNVLLEEKEALFLNYRYVLVGKRTFSALLTILSWTNTLFCKKSWFFFYLQTIDGVLHTII